MLCQLNLFGDRSYPVLARQGVAGPSGTKRTKPAGSPKSSAFIIQHQSSPQSRFPYTYPPHPELYLVCPRGTTVPINTNGTSPSAPPSAASNPKSQAESFTSPDAIQS